MSDRGDWDPWDLGEPEDAWDDPEVDTDRGLGAADGLDDDRPGLAGGPPRGALVTALGVMLVLAVGIAAVILRGDDDDDGGGDEAASELETDDERPSTSSSSSSSTTVAGAAGDGAPDVPGSTSTTRRRTSTTREPGAATTSTTADEAELPACESGEGSAEEVPADWRERWQTMPGPNDPARISICIDDVTPRVGQPVEVWLRADDPDAVIVEGDCGYRLLWEDEGSASLCRDALVPRDGPRPTPDQEPGHVLVRFTHVYDTPGRRTIYGSVSSSRWEGYRSPYASEAEASLPITVLP